MATTTAHTSSSSSSSTMDKKQASLQEMLQKVEASLLPAIESFGSSISDGIDNRQSSSSASSIAVIPGLDFLHVKNDLLLSYLIDLVVWLRDYSSRDVSDSDPTTTAVEDNNASLLRRRLVEMRTILDKSRALDKKLRYQIDKLLAAASSSFAYATSDDKNGDNDRDARATDSGPADVEDPLHFRPDPTSLQGMGADDGDNDDDDGEGEEGWEDGHNGEQDGSMDDDDLAAARATLELSKQKTTRTKKKTNMNASHNGGDGNGNSAPSGGTVTNGVYRAPRLTAVPYKHDTQDKQREASKREIRRLRSTELAQTLRSQYGDAPDQEDIHGGGSDYGKQRAASRKLAQREAMRTKYEESAMIRITTTRKEKKEKKRVERMEGSNLDAITNIGSLVRESQVFDRTSSPNNSIEGDMRTKKGRGPKEDTDDRSRYHNGKRRKRTNNY